MKKILVILMCTFAVHVQAQEGVAINNDGASPDASSILDLKSTTKGILIPRMTESQRTQISNVATGLLVFQTDGTSGFYFYSGSGWESLSTKSNTLDEAYDEGGSGAGRQIDASDGAVRINGDDGLIVTGTYGSGDAVEVSDEGSRMFFNPNKGAFRAGAVVGAEWDWANIGNSSTAVGWGTSASGVGSTAMGVNTNASGDYSTAMGLSTSAPSAYETAIGGYNTSYVPSSTANWNAADRLFIVGNGTDLGAESNALTIYKDGRMNINDAYDMPLADGIAGQVLTTDGAGILTFQTNYQDLSLTGNTLSLTNDATTVDLSAYLDNTDAQDLSLTGNTLSLTNDATTVDLSAYQNNTLDEAYDEGGAGAGRQIDASDGAVRINGDDGFIVTGTYNSGDAVEVSGAGTRMFFNPYKAAFRAGYVDGTQWDWANIGHFSTAMGYNSKASGSYSTAMGDSTTASGDYSTAMGETTTASGSISTAMGSYSTASGSYSTAMGRETTAFGINSTAMGRETTAFGINSTAMGLNTTASGDYSTAMSRSTTASGDYSTAMGWSTEAIGDYSTAMGRATTASGSISTAMGESTTASGDNSTAMGESTTASGEHSTAMGEYTSASGNQSTAMGYYTEAIGDYSTAMGNQTEASGWYSTAMGYKTTADYMATAMGRETTASGAQSTAMGLATTASGGSSTAMGWGTTASGHNSTAMGESTTASGDNSTAMGESTTASGDNSTGIGHGLTAPSYAETVVGCNNTTYSLSLSLYSASAWYPNDRLFVVGNGEDEYPWSLSNALTIYKNGRMNINDAYDMPMSDGSAGQVMTTDGAGVVSFQNTVAGWELLGNAGTVNGTNFIGTTDAQDLDIRTNNVIHHRFTQQGQIEFLNTGHSIFIGTGAGENDDLNVNKYNVFIGEDVARYISTGSWNTATGYKALGFNIHGNANTASGSFALYTNKGDGNTANGCSALYSNKYGIYNTANGYRALYSNDDGNNNTANGYRALYSNTTGDANTANGYEALYLNTVSYNTANGYQALRYNSTGSYNTANGSRALYANTTGYNNTANGYRALYSNTTGSYNTANGDSTLCFNTTGYNNTANGHRALSSNTEGYSNTANGNSSLYENTTGSYNVANGYEALYENTTGSYNVAHGFQALNSNTTGNSNVAIGVRALLNNGNDMGFAHGSNLVAIGDSAMYYNGYGAQNNWHGINNTAVGSKALFSNRTGSYNTAHGFQALYSNTGSRNTATGRQALYSNTTGYYNTANGYEALYSNTEGDYNTALGNSADVASGNLTNATAIGYNAEVDASNKIQLGNTSVTSVATSGALTTGAVTYPNTDGTAGQVLTTDGAGILTFQTNYQDLSLTGNTLSLTNDVTTVDLSSFAQDLTLTGNTLSLTNDATTVDLTAYQNNTLDEAYDEGGAGAGRTIAASDGAVRVNGDDGFIVTGTYGSGDAVEVSGLGTRMFFNPYKAAFRAGYVDGTVWDDVNIGDYSTAMGRETSASGSYSTAMGEYTTASGDNSTAMGYDAVASGIYSTAMGRSTTASGSHSTAMGRVTTASGSHSTAMGYVTSAPSGYETAIGRYNTSYAPVSTTGWNAADRLFVVGNGTNTGSLESDAMVILKSGNVGIGTSSPNSKLHVNNPSTATGAHFRVQDAGNTRFCVANNGNTALYFNDAPAYKLQLNVDDAAKPTSSAWTVASDARLKTNVSPFSDGLNVLMAINPVWFRYNGKAGMPTDKRGVGTIAQELQKIAPYMVNEWTFTEGSLDESTARPDGPRTTTNYLGVNYGAMDFIVINSIQEQQSIIESQKAEIDELKTRMTEMDELKAQMIEMQAALNALNQKNKGKKK